MEKFYTGIGSRSAPEWALATAFNLGIRLAKLGFTLRSGGADGMDTSFENGCDKANGKKEIYLPWKNFNGNKSPLFQIDEIGMSAASLVHPNWNNLTTPVKKLHTRNVYQITSYDLNTLTRFVICYTPWDKGGTLQAIRLANELDVLVVNLFEYESSLWDITTYEGINEIIDSVLKRVLIIKYRNLKINPKAVKIIWDFRGEDYYLSNFYLSEFKYKGKTYFYVENAYQSYKTNPPSERIRVSNNPGTAKKLGKEVKLRSDWEEIKDQLMFEMVKAKFEQNNELKYKLIDTGDTSLIEGNHWHDNYWGDCTCDKCINIAGQNKLGKILMQVRELLKKDEKQVHYCKLYNDYRTDITCNEMSCEFCDKFYDMDRKQWWYHPESHYYFLASHNEMKNMHSTIECDNVDNRIKTRVVNVKTEPYDVYCGRGSKYGNPFIIGKDGDRKTVIDKYRKYLDQNIDLQIALLKLKGMKLGCYCAPKDCHVDVIAEFIENYTD